MLLENLEEFDKRINNKEIYGDAMTLCISLKENLPLLNKQRPLINYNGMFACKNS